MDADIRRSNGYSLVELLVVMGIIGVLTYLVMPVFSSVRGKTRQLTCLSNLHQLSLALRLYVDEHDGVYPYDVKPRAPALPGVDPAYDGTNKADASPVVSLLQPLSARKAAFCPDQPKSLPDIGPLTNYTFNGHLALNDSPQAPHPGPVTDADIVHPDQVTTFADHPAGGRSHAGYRNFAFCDGSTKALSANQQETLADYTMWWK